MPARDPICPACQKPIRPGQSTARDDDGNLVHVECWKDTKRKE